MKAVAYQQNKALQNIEIEKPVANGHDVLVKVQAVAVNPVDVKVRSRVAPDADDYKILGWDAVGEVVEVGEKVSLFKPGDQVWYAGAIDRPGCHSEYHLVDEYITALKPATLSYAQAAAMPLTSITAWELLFDRFEVNNRGQGGHMLIIGGAGGVGSMMIQLAKQLTGLTVITTASREESRAWVSQLGADYVIDPHQSLSQQIQQLGINSVEYAAGLTHSGEHFEEIVKCLAPQGKFGLIDDPGALDISLLKQKSISLHWEFMYTRSLFQTEDKIRQHQLLNQVAGLVDQGLLVTTIRENYGAINAENLERAFALLESGQGIGKLVLEEW